ncbi:DNA-processing protein DprA [Caenimonas koreensis DSM 17982]|uniref:DNA-processing protein DprA n=2 Tax=Caenimonas TaxID=763439 RepID=A0A844B455_9BURK|nr:DNA-processing protein DprA [Caenimonas koreensis DSM 17982]
MGAYEYLWMQPGMSVRRMAALLGREGAWLPSELVPQDKARETWAEVIAEFERRGVANFGVRLYGAWTYPACLRDAKEPIGGLYFRGSWDLAESPRRISVVGTREVSPEGRDRTRKLVRQLVASGFTIVSGLARGVDTIAHTAAMEFGGRTFAVIGTPISESYPRENAALQEALANKYLVVSQVPVLRYKRQDYRRNRLFFPERNKTMSALTQATVIVEAGETSGTLTQARAALDQGRRLFILESNFHKPGLAWPAELERLGATRVADFSQILEAFA